MNFDDTEECLNWARFVLHLEGHSEWEIEFSESQSGAEGITLFNGKKIILHWPRNICWPVLCLHEIAHVKRGDHGSNQHDSEFAHQFMYLVTKYMRPVSLAVAFDVMAAPRKSRG